MKYAARLSAFAFAALLALPAQAKPERYEFDKEHTNILFYVNHLGFSDMVGRMTAYEGYFMFDPKSPKDGSVQITFDPAGIQTSSKALDEHLQKDDWFNTAKYPSVTFKSTGIQVTGDNTANVTGELTLLGVTKPVVLKLRHNKSDVHPMTKKLVAGFSGEVTLKRSDFGMNSGIPMVGDEVRITIESEGVNASDVAVTKH